MVTAPRPSPSSSLWLLVLGLGITVGVAAALLSGVFTPPGAPATSTTVGPGNQIVLWIAEIVPIAAIAFFIFFRLTRETAPVPGRLIAPALIVILILVVFVLLVRVNLISSNTPLTKQVPPGLNQTNQSYYSPGGNYTNATSFGWGGMVNFLGINLPLWAAVSIGAAIVIAVGVVATIFVLRFPGRQRPMGPSTPAGGVRIELESAARALDEGTGDPRQVLIALYARLLRRLEPAVGDLATSTAEEIRSHYLIRLGVQPATADEITRLFELARYSSHPIGPAEVARARAVLAAAIGDLNSPRAA